MPSASDIREAWRTHPAYLIDRYGGQQGTRALVVVPAREAPMINRACQWLRDHRYELEPYISEQGYQWALEPEAYELGTEAFWQIRALQQLASFRDSEARAGRVPTDTSGVAIRQSFVTKYDIMSPRYWKSSGIHFVIMPHGYFDFSMLIWEAFARWCRHTPDGPLWNGATTMVPDGLSNAGDPWLLEAIARQIAQPARDVDIKQVDAAGAIARAVPAFSTAVGLYDVDESEPFVKDVSYTLADFVMGHEMGHRAAGHVHVSQPESAYLANETDADGRGFDFFSASWGWRAEIIASAPFDDVGQPILGQLVFLHTTRLRGVLSMAVKARSEAVRGTSVKRLGPGWRPVDEDRARRLTAKGISYLHNVLAMGVAVPDETITRLGAFAANVGRYAEHIISTVDSIPADDFRQALDITDRLAEPI